MARIFVDGRVPDVSRRIGEILRQDRHEIEFVDSARQIDGRLGGKTHNVLILTGAPDERRAASMRHVFSEQVPNPPVIGVRGAADDGTGGDGSGGDDAPGAAAWSALDDVLALPLDPTTVRQTVRTQLARYELQLETGIIGRTEAMQEVLERIHLIAPVHSTVLLTGESGTGKELVARAIHRASRRRASPFIPVNCAALPESLLESELFGHEKGAFTGATSLRRGMFELADRGTLFLDEIAEMPLGTQTRLLRVLEARSFMRVGGDHEIDVDVRIVAATNRDLRSAVTAGDFRRDLYYRVNVLQIHLPPLRERQDDIPLLVKRFVREFASAHDRRFRGIAPDTLDLLLGYSWPGNVRELRNLIENMVVLAPGGVIRPGDLPAEIRRNKPQLPVPIENTVTPPTTVGLTDPATIEFIFRTLVELKADVEGLKRELRDRNLQALPAGFEPGAEIEVIERLQPDQRDGQAEDQQSDWEEGDADPEAIWSLAFRLGLTFDEIQRKVIEATLERTGGNRRETARRLGIPERTLYRRLREYESADPNGGSSKV